MEPSDVVISTVLVTGATGHLGRLLVLRLRAAGHQVRTFSRKGQTVPAHGAFAGDLTDGSGLAEALEGVDAVVHCASDPRHPDADVTSTNNLIRAMTDIGRGPHLVFVSIVGVDAIPWGYYRAKHQAEQAVERAALPWTIQRATQFHAFVDTMLQPLAKSPVMVLPRGFSFQPVDATEVADRLVHHVGNGAAGRAIDIGGPEVLAATELARSWLQAHRRRRAVVAVPVPGKIGSAFRGGANLCPDGLRGRITWSEHLDAVRTASSPLPHRPV